MSKVFAFFAMTALEVEGARVARHQVGADVASHTNQSLGWSPCALGMCYKGWGTNRMANIPGTGGVGDAGCMKPFVGCGSDKPMKCVFGACPRNFGSDGGCVSTSACKSYCDVDHAGSCTYHGPRDTGDYSRWMREFSDVPLNKLLMVEGHHVLGELGTLDFSKPVTEGLKILKTLGDMSWLPGFGNIVDIAHASLLPMFSSTQSSNVATLLRAGVRGFDFRPYLSKRDEKLHDSHGGQGTLVEPAIRAIGSFLRNNPSEVVVMNIQNVRYNGDGQCLECSTGDVWAELNRVLRRHLGSCSNGVVECNADIRKTVGQLGGRVIIHSNRNQLVSKAAGLVHASSSIYHAPWYNKNSLSELRDHVLSDSTLQSRSQSDRYLIGHQWVLSPHADDFIGAVTQRFTGEYQGKANPHGCQSLACFGEVASARSFKDNFKAIRNRYKRSNFVMLDFADRAGTMAAVLSINRQYARS